MPRLTEYKLRTSSDALMLDVEAIRDFCGRNLTVVDCGYVAIVSAAISLGFGGCFVSD
jgi:hypothetical protein